MWLDTHKSLYVCLHHITTIFHLVVAIHCYFLYYIPYLKNGQTHCFKQRRKSISGEDNSKKEENYWLKGNKGSHLKKMKRGSKFKKNSTHIFELHATLQSSCRRYSNMKKDAENFSLTSHGRVNNELDFKDNSQFRTYPTIEILDELGSLPDRALVSKLFDVNSSDVAASLSKFRMWK